MLQVYKRTHLPKIWNHTLTWMLSWKFPIYFWNTLFKEHLFLTAYVASWFHRRYFESSVKCEYYFLQLIANSSKYRALRSILYLANIFLLVTIEVESYIKLFAFLSQLFKLYFACGIEKIRKYFSRWFRNLRVSKTIYLSSIRKKSLAFCIFRLNFNRMKIYNVALYLIFQ